MALSGITRIDDLFNSVACTNPIVQGDPDRKTVGVIQDLLAGHGAMGMPGPRNTSYGSFGPATRKALLDFRSQKMGLKNPDNVKVDHQTLLRLKWVE